MHAVIFAFKRAFQSSLRITRPLVTPHGLTAARFDMLYAIQTFTPRCDPEQQPWLLQRKLVEVLGVTAATVSRMVRSLEERGFVTRARDDGDRRCVRVTLTRLGACALHAAYFTLVVLGYVQLALECAVAYDAWVTDDERFVPLSDLEDLLRNVRRTFRDRGCLSYPWHPDD